MCLDSLYQRLKLKNHCNLLKIKILALFVKFERGGREKTLKQIKLMKLWFVEQEFEITTCFARYSHLRYRIFISKSKILYLGFELGMESNEEYIIGELEKSKRKLREITVNLDAQQQLLRLIVQVRDNLNIL